jgi:hypothetical protein
MEIILAIAVIIVAYLLIVIIPVGLGKLLFRWSGTRVLYILGTSLGAIIGSVVASLLLTGLILLIGLVFQQEWAFSGGLLIIYTFWVAIKSVRETIRESKGM